MRRLILLAAWLITTSTYAATPLHNLSDTWNNAGTVFDGIKMNVTNTASAAGSDLIDLQIGGATIFSVEKTGEVSIAVDSFGVLMGAGGDASFLYDGTNVQVNCRVVGSGDFVVKGDIKAQADSTYTLGETGVRWTTIYVDAADIAGNLTITGTVDGRDVSTDGTKLDTIDTNAADDQTAAEIRTLVEAATDSNVFTDADHTTLNGVSTTYLPLAGGTMTGDIATDQWLGVDENTALGVGAFGAGNLTHTAGTDGWYNTAVGYRVLYANTTGERNSAFGTSAMSANTTGSSNSAFGRYSLQANTTGSSNTAVGYATMFNTIDGDQNTAIGRYALHNNVSGDNNTAIGFSSLYSTTGVNNSGFGYRSGYSNTSGARNVTAGSDTFYFCTTGSNNLAMGHSAGNYHADGTTPLQTPENSVFLGASTRGLDETDINSIVIGYQAIGLGANTVVLGNESILTTRLWGNLLLGTTTSPTGTNGKVMSFGDNGGDPTMGTDVAGFFCKDSGGGNMAMYAIDEADTVSIISPHDPDTQEWVFYSANQRTGKHYRVNMEKLVAVVEAYTGEDLAQEWNTKNGEKEPVVKISRKEWDDTKAQISMLKKQIDANGNNANVPWLAAGCVLALTFYFTRKKTEHAIAA